MPLLLPPAPNLRPSDLSYLHAYNSIIARVRRSAGSSSAGVVILAGCDLDGLLAARILVALLKQDDVSYRLVPIGGYSELEAKRDEALASEELHTLILLSLGCLLPLASYFSLPDSVQLHIIDAHRPWNLANLFDIEVLGTGGPRADEAGPSTGQGRIWVWGDGEERGLREIRKSYDALELMPSDSDSDSDSNSDDYDDEDEDDEEDEGEDEDEGRDEDQDAEAGSEDGSGENGVAKRARANGGAGAKKKRRREEDPDRPRRLPRAVRNAHYDRIQRYYASGTSWGMSVAQSVYLLAAELERADNDMLWYAILGLTHQYVASRIDRDRYEAYQGLFLDEVVRLNTAPLPGAGKVPNPDDRSISASDELRFMLFRHWNLYEAMLHSGYVAGRMGIWKEKGRKRLQGLLAKMGFSLQQCQQAYAHMDIALKRQLPEKLDAIAPEYGLIELSYPSFTRSYGFQLSVVSAADAVEGISALLEAASGVRLEVDKEGGRGGGEWFGGTRTWSVGVGEDKENLDPRRAVAKEGANGATNGNSEGAPDSQVAKRVDPSWQTKNFWIAFDSLENVSLLRRALPLAMSLHQAIIRQGSSLLDKASIRPLRTFRFATMREGPDLRLFSHPSTLSRLALWLVDATRDRWAAKEAKQGGKGPKSLPFVIACLNEDKGTYLVVGVTGAPEFGDVRRNKFGLAFQEAADESGAGAKHDFFETSTVEVNQEDLTAFIEALHLKSS